MNTDAHTQTHTSTLPHPVPLSLLVEQNDDQLGVHLVSVLAERQITPLKRHIHQVPAEGNVEMRHSWGAHHCLKNTSVSGSSQQLYLPNTSTLFVLWWLNFLNIKVLQPQFALKFLYFQTNPQTSHKYIMWLELSANVYPGFHNIHKYMSHQ